MTTTTTALARVGHQMLTFDQMLDMGDELVNTGFLPDHIQDGAQCAAIILTGQELGMPPMLAIRSLQVIKGKVVEAADSQLARFKEQGGHSSFLILTGKEARLHLVHPNGDEHTESFTMEDADNAGLIKQGGNYEKFEKAMLRSRVITAGLKSLGWKGAIGAYDPGEVQHFAKTAEQNGEPKDEIKVTGTGPAKDEPGSDDDLEDDSPCTNCGVHPDQHESKEMDDDCPAEPAKEPAQSSTELLLEYAGLVRDSGDLQELTEVHALYIERLEKIGRGLKYAMAYYAKRNGALDDDAGKVDEETNELAKVVEDLLRDQKESDDE